MMNELEKKADKEIREAVEAYRRASKLTNQRFSSMIQSRNSGILDVLWNLFPHLEAWSETGWCETRRKP